LGNLTDDQWVSTTSGAQTVYGEGTSSVNQGSSDEVANLSTFGRLYNWYAVNDERGLCPTGWHVPTDGEWTVLQNFLGGSSIAGAKMKSSPSDTPAWNGTNSSGFSALPAGFRLYYNGDFNSLGSHGGWWSSSAYATSNAWGPLLFSDVEIVDRNSSFYRDGWSVRCVRDEGVICLDPDNDGVCAENEVSGCADSNAMNFNPFATEDDGSCVLPGPAQCGGASTITFDGYTYNLMGIGSQCWFKENLRSDNYRNGDPIPGNLSYGGYNSWWSTNQGAQCAYDNNDANIDDSGRLYNFFAVVDSRELCPSGFHVPTFNDFSQLVNVWGGANIAGMHLKASPSDITPWNGTNLSGFTAIPGGGRFDNTGNWDDYGSDGNYWSSTIAPFNEITGGRYLSLKSDAEARDAVYPPRGGFSVRCLKD
jgi:uncharacterized protein (TIGR02145 family)